MKEEIQLSAKVYDTLKAEAERVGGIGLLEWFRELGGEGLEGFDLTCPICINGMACSTGLYSIKDVLQTDEETGVTYVDWPMAAVGITAQQNDNAVADLIVEGKYTFDKHGIKRVSWDDYVRELNIVRVEEEEVVTAGDMMGL